MFCYVAVMSSVINIHHIPVCVCFQVEAEGAKTSHQYRARPEPDVGNLAVTRCQQDAADFDSNTENLVTSTIGGQILTETEEDILSEFLVMFIIL